MSYELTFVDIKDNNSFIKFTPEEKGVNELIYKDDSIDTVKLKFIRTAVSKGIDNIFYDSVFLFYQEMKTSLDERLYNEISNGKKTVNANRVKTFLKNVRTNSNEKIVIGNDKLKEYYSIDEMRDLLPEPFYIYTPLTRSFSSKEYIPINPVDIETIDDIIRGSVASNHGSQLIMTVGDIFKNTIYYCVANDILKNKNDYDLKILELYYQYLFYSDIKSKGDLSTLPPKFKELSSGALNNEFLTRNNENINLMHEIYQEQRVEFKEIDKGFQEIDVTIRQTDMFFFPLENIFKTIHASNQIPFIKYNPSKKSDNLYRLFTDKINTTGKKIPSLAKGVIINLIDSCALKKSIAYYVSDDSQPSKNIIVELEETGDIKVKVLILKMKITKDEANAIIVTTTNNFINKLKEYTLPNGYTIDPIKNIYQDNISINSIKYVINLKTDTDIDFSKYLNCFSSIFAFADFSKGQQNIRSETEMYYKRVSNYSETDNQQLFIDKLKKDKQQDIYIVSALTKHYFISHELAVKRLQSYNDSSSSQVVQKGISRRRLNIKKSYGFHTKITRNIGNVYTLTIEDINDIKYIDLIDIYVNSMFLICTQTTPKGFEKKIKKLCSKDEIKIVNDLSQIDEDNFDENNDDKENDPQKDDGKYNNDDSPYDLNPVNSSRQIDQQEKRDETYEKLKKYWNEMKQTSFSSIVVIKPDDIFSRLSKEELQKYEKKYEEESKEALLLFNVSSAVEGIEQSNVEKAIDSIYDYDYDDGDDDDDDGGDDAGTEGGVEEKKDKESIPNSKKKIQSITGLKINNPNYFSKRLIERQPNVFLNDSKKYSKYMYSRKCPSSENRQPIILTQEEKDNIDPKSYNNESIEYTSKGDNKTYHYICPRYWSISENVSLTDEMVKSGKHGKVISLDSDYKKNGLKKGENIFEFTNDEKYNERHPGFLEDKVHPNGECVPCCFSKKTSGKRNNTCATRNKKKEDSSELAIAPNEGKEKDDLNVYIKETKSPLEKGRWGFLHPPVEKFFKTDNKKCTTSSSKIKLNHPCILRYGIEINKNQSFISLVANIWQDKHEVGKTPTIIEMKKLLIDSLNIDLYIGLQNGYLVDIFQDQDSVDDIDQIDHNEIIKESNVYKKTSFGVPEQSFLYYKQVKSYYNFIAYLKDDSVKIDHKYIWDLVCTPNPNLFPNGINLVIIEISDETETLDIICPSNHYSSELFDYKKDTAICIKNGDYYEPIFIFQETEKTYEITRLYNILNQDLLLNIKNVLQMVGKELNEKCIPISIEKSKNKVTEPSSKKLIEQLSEIKNCEINHQIINYNGRVIGIHAKVKDVGSGMIPCNSSPIKMDIDYKWIDSVTNEFGPNYDLLLNISKHFTACKPSKKLIDKQNNVLGIITLANSFVPVIPLKIPQPQQDQGSLYDKLATLKAVYDKNYNEIDKETMTTNSQDRERVDGVKRILLETNLYNNFRNWVRKSINDPINKKTKLKIETIISDSKELYFSKLSKVDESLKVMMKGRVNFKNIDINTLDTDGKNAFVCDEESSEEEVKGQRDPSKCSNVILNLPHKNLLNNADNEQMYFIHMADELIRYSRINSFIFNKSFLEFSEFNYNVSDNEIILLEFVLKEYLNDNNQIEPMNKYIKFNSFGTTNPRTNDIKNNNDNLVDEVEEKDNIISEEEKKNPVVMAIPIKTVPVSALVGRKIIKNIKKIKKVKVKK